MKAPSYIDNVTLLHCTRWRPICRRARHLLQEKSISYNEIDIEHTPGARAKLRELTGGTLTTSPFVIGQETIVDFQPDRRDRALRARLI